MAELDDQTESLVQQLYHAWSTNADPTLYLDLRDQTLSRRERVDTCIATLKTVITVTCPQISETERYLDPKWKELFALAESIESVAKEDDPNNPRKRKRSYNEVHRLRNLAVVSALWSPGVVRYYGWNNAAQGCLRLLKTCALRFPRFGEQFCPHLNRVLLDRHREAILSGHLKNLNEAPLQCYRDLNILVEGAGIVPDLETEALWVNSSDGAVPLDVNGRLLKDLRPFHVQQHLLRRDRYGMLVARGEDDALPEAVHQPPEFSLLEPSVYEQCFTHDDTFLSNIPGLAISPPDVFTSSGLDAILDGLASTYQGENLPYGLDAASIMTSPCDDAGDPMTDVQNHASSITLPNDSAVDLTSSLDRVPDSDNTFFSFSVPEPSRVESNGTASSKTGPRKSMRRRTREDSPASIPKASRTARFAANPASTHPQSGTPPSLRKAKPTIEDELQDQYDQMLSTYVQQLKEQIVLGNVQRRVRSQWLTSDTKWARVWSMPGSKNLPPGAATSKADCDVLYCSAAAFLEAARSGEVFKKPVIIKESFSDTGMHSYERFLSLLEDASSSDEQVEARCIDIEPPMHEALGKFTEYLRSQHAISDTLWVSTARSFAKCHRPLFTMLNRFRLLESLSEGLHDRRSDSPPSPLTKAMSVSFNTMAFPGAFSGSYLNTLAGSWQRNLFGVRFWVFVPESSVPRDELAGLAKEESDWVPRGKQRLVVLEENDVLFVPPGLRLVQTWHAPTTCLTEQGMLWDDLSILSILESMTWGRDNQVVQDDPASQQLPRIVNNLDHLIREQPDRFRRNMSQEEFLVRFREAGRPWLAPCQD